MAKKKTENKTTSSAKSEDFVNDAVSNPPMKDETPPVDDEKNKETPHENGFVAKSVFVTLRANHPHDSYGRVGYRFNKIEPVEIDINALSEDRLHALMDDPWLDTVFSTEE